MWALTLSCPKVVSYPYDTPNLLTQVCSDVCIEPELQPMFWEVLSMLPRTLKMACASTLPPMVSGEDSSKEHFSMSVSSIHILPPTGSLAWQHATANKSCLKSAYEQRVRQVEHSSFTPLVLSATGGMANNATTFYKRLASCLAVKWDHSYPLTMSWLHYRLNFSLLCSAI